MFNSVILEIVIGLIFIYLLYSLLATVVQEIVSTKIYFGKDDYLCHLLDSFASSLNDFTSIFYSPLMR